jgi:dTDP-4-dehydrorhamnose reductase
MILVTGCEGQVGFELLRTLAPLGAVKGVSRKDADLTDPASVEKLLANYKPKCIVNAAAYTAVDNAENDMATAKALNADLPAQLAAWAKLNGAILFHYSTDYVYSGSGSKPWQETDTPGPLSVYGKTKLAGDEAVIAADCGAAIFRTSWVYSSRGHNFMLTMLRLAKEREQLAVVADQWGAPTPAWLIAQITAFALKEKLKNSNSLYGIYHLAAAGETNWCDFAKAIISRADEMVGGYKASASSVKPITTDEYPAPAPRPTNSRLDITRVEEALNIQVPHWLDALELTLKNRFSLQER